jgi:predicted SAM-dependent methyltransferase
MINPLMPVRAGFTFLKSRRLIKAYLSSPRPHCLNIGASGAPIQGWLNVDLSVTDNIVFLDATRRFPFDDYSFDYIFTEHMIEHLDFNEGRNFLKECYRVLLPGGKIRIATPDLLFLMDLYRPMRTELQDRYIRQTVDEYFPDARLYQPCLVINNFVRNWGHSFIYDSATLEAVLLGAGFIKVTSCTPGDSLDNHLQGLERHGMFIGDDFNRLETLVLEAIRGGL